MTDVKTPTWLVAQIGARRHYAIPALLEQAGILERLDTDLCAQSIVVRAIDRLVPRRLHPKAVARLIARTVRDVPAEKIRCFPVDALRRLLVRRNNGAAAAYRRWIDANRRFNRRVVRSGFGQAGGVYVFNGAGLEILERAKRLGLRTVVDQTDAPVAVEEALLAEERARWADWEEGTVHPDDWMPMAERERAEWNLADVILCGSEYVRSGIAQAGGPSESVAVLPYGVPPEMFVPRASRADDGELRVLFAGTLCLRKGFPYVVEAARRLASRRIVFRAVGPANFSEAALNRSRAHVEIAGPVPRSSMAGEYAWADVLLLPSISEGSANVCYEALSAGLPVITTRHAGSVIRDGQDGCIVPIRDPDAIAEQIERLACDPQARAAMARSARERASEFTWEHYATRLIAVIGRLDMRGIAPRADREHHAKQRVSQL